MKDLEIIKSLVGDSLLEDDLKYVECFVHDKVGLFIPSMGTCGYAQQDNHTHPSYMIVIMFSADVANIPIERNHYLATVTSPGVPHCDISDENINYYCVLINKPYFEEQFIMYADHVPVYNEQQFYLCHDILKTLNTFAFECNKNIKTQALRCLRR